MVDSALGRCRTQSWTTKELEISLNSSDKPVKQNQPGIMCDLCARWTHAECCTINKQQYNLLPSQGESQQWYCPFCQLSELPFADTTLRSQSPSLTGYLNDFSLPSDNVSEKMCKKLSSLSLNARSIMNKVPDLEALLKCHNTDAVAITETFLSDEIQDSEIVNSDFKIFQRDRNRHGGGVMFIIKSCIPAIRRQDLETDCEVLWIELFLRKVSVILGVFYNPPAPTVTI